MLFLIRSMNDRMKCFDSKNQSCVTSSSIHETVVCVWPWHMLLTHALDVKAPWRFQCPPRPDVPENLQVRLPPSDQQHLFLHPAEEEDLRERVHQRLVPEVPHVGGFEARKHLVPAVMLRLCALRRRRGCGVLLGLSADPRQHQSERVRS